MSNADRSRWRQRLENFDKALAQLNSATAKDSYTMLERAGLVRIFEFTFELAWKTLKDLLFCEGYDVKTPRGVIRNGLEPAIVMPDACHGVLVASLDTSIMRSASDTVSTPVAFVSAELLLAVVA